MIFIRSINFSENEFNIFSGKQVFRGRSSIFYLLNANELLKTFKFRGRAYLENKEYILSNLMFYREKLQHLNVVLPTSLINVDDELRGFSMDYIADAITLDKKLKDSSVSIKEKIEYLKDVGKMLEKMKFIREHERIENLFLNDIHEDNFIVDSKNRLYFVDVDSIRVFDAKTVPAKYLRNTLPIDYFYKYKWYYGYEYGDYIANEDTDLYSYIIMIMNMVVGRPSYKLSIAEYFNYLRLLQYSGVGKNLIEIFSLIYSNNPNINPYPFLDELTPFLVDDGPNKIKKLL